MNRRLPPSWNWLAKLISHNLYQCNPWFSSGDAHNYHWHKPAVFYSFNNSYMKLKRRLISQWTFQGRPNVTKTMWTFQKLPNITKTVSALLAVSLTAGLDMISSWHPVTCNSTLVISRGTTIYFNSCLICNQATALMWTPSSLHHFKEKLNWVITNSQ